MIESSAHDAREVPWAAEEPLPYGVLTLDTAQRVLRADAHFCRVFDCARHDIEGKLLEELLNPTDRRAAMTLHVGLSRYQGGFVDFPAELRLGGSAFHARLRLTRARAGWLAYVERIDDSDLVYDLLLARERWGAIFQNSNDGIAVLSPKNRIIEFNQRFYALAQFRSAHGVLLSEDALVGRPLAQLLRPDALPAFKTMLEDATASEGIDATTIGGRQLEFRMNRLVLPVRGVVGTCVIVRDVSERKQLEELRVRHAAAHYAGMAEVANNLLHNLGNMCGSIPFFSEEIMKTLERSLIGRMERASALLKEHSADLPRFLTEDPKGKLLPEFYLRIGDSLEGERRHFVQLVSDLTSKVQLVKEAIASQQTYAKGTHFVETLDLDMVVDDALNIERTAFERHGVEVLRCGGNVGNVRAQRSKLVHILLNLMRNAIDSMDGKCDPRVLTVETGRHASGEGYVRVTDNGKGIAPEHRPRLFTHGFTTKKSGHGFGLHFCALAMEEMGGTIAVDSEGVGRGAAFVVSFASDPAVRARVSSFPVPAQQQEGGSHGG